MVLQKNIQELQNAQQAIVAHQRDRRQHKQRQALTRAHNSIFDLISMVEHSTQVRVGFGIGLFFLGGRRQLWCNRFFCQMFVVISIFFGREAVRILWGASGFCGFGANLCAGLFKNLKVVYFCTTSTELAKFEVGHKPKKVSYAIFCLKGSSLKQHGCFRSPLRGEMGCLFRARALIVVLFSFLARPTHTFNSEASLHLHDASKMMHLTMSPETFWRSPRSDEVKV